LLLPVLALVLSCGARRPKTPERTLKVNTKITVAKIRTGYLIAILEDESSRLARVDVRYPAGSADDPPGKEGLAHLVEHLLFEFDVPQHGGEGTTSLFAEFGRVATYFNASTTADYMHFEAQALPSAMPELLALEATRASTACDKIHPDVFEREKEVVVNELRERLGAGGSDLRADMHSALYPEGHPYHDVASVASVSSLTQEDVCLFMADQFRRGQATIVVSGNVNEAEVRAAVGEAFAQVPSRFAEKNPIAPAAIGKASKHTITADVAEGTYMMAWPLPAEGTREYRLLQMARSNMESALSDFAYTYGWGHNVDTWIAGGGEAPYLVLQVKLRSMKHVSDADDAARKSVRQMYRYLKSSGEGKRSVWWTRRMIRREATLLAQYEPLESRADMYSGYFLYEEDFTLLIDKLKELRTSTPTEVRGLAEKWINPDKAKVIVVAPGNAGASGGSVQSAFASGHTNVRGITVDPRDADRPIELPADGTGLALETTRYRMGNGLKVVFWPHGAVPVLNSRLVTQSGAAMDPKNKEGTAMVSGFDDVFEDSMVYWQFNLSFMVDSVLRDILYELRSPGRSVSTKVRTHLKSRLNLRGSKAMRKFQQDMRVAIYGAEHPYARPAMTAKSIDAMTRDRVLGWARKHIVPKNSTLILTGKFEPSQAKAWINYLVDHVSGGSEAKPIAALAQSQAPAWIGGEGLANKPTVDIDVRFAGSRGVDDSQATRMVLASILTSKLADMRQGHAISYGMSARYVNRVAGGYWQITGSVDASRAAQAGQLLRATLDSVRSGTGAYKPAFVLARRKNVDALLASASNSGVVARRLEFIARFALTDSFYDTLVRKMAALTPNDVDTLLASELGASNQVTGAFGAPVAVRAFLEGTKTLAPPN
tara:strand:+ start:1062 stop:3713 length:2652 start_codon:yes stop_codon:yes gene_type:complete